MNTQSLLIRLAVNFPQKLLSLFIALILVATSVTFSKSVSAATFLLSGKVTDQSSSPISGTSVDVLNPGTTIVVASDTTDINGDYSILIEEGTYDVRVTPPVGSEFNSAIALNQVISDNAILKFFLVTTGSATLSGYLYDPPGNPVPNQRVLFTRNN